MRNLLVYLDSLFQLGDIGTRIARVRVIFKLPESLDHTPTPSFWPKGPLAYVEWYTSLKPTAEPAHNMYTVKRLLRSDGSISGAIIPLSSIRQSCMLIPIYGTKAMDGLASNNVLDKTTSFAVNSWTDLYTYQTVW